MTPYVLEVIISYRTAKIFTFKCVRKVIDKKKELVKNKVVKMFQINTFSK